MKYPLIIFDWDGTLLDSAAYIVKCVGRVVDDFNLTVPSEDQIRKNIGLSLDRSLEILMPQLDAEMIAKLAERFRYYV